MRMFDWEDLDNMGIYLLDGDIVEENELEDIKLRYYEKPDNNLDWE